MEILPPVNRFSRLPGSYTPPKLCARAYAKVDKQGVGVALNSTRDSLSSSLPGIRRSEWPSEDLKESRISDPRTNDRIRVPEVRLVGAEGEQIGVVAIDVALRLAQEADLDLVEVAPNSKPPVAKIMDYGKFKYEEGQKAKEARKKSTNVSRRK